MYAPWRILLLIYATPENGGFFYEVKGMFSSEKNSFVEYTYLEVV
jgi:hypothetical protein